jgi:hypothetical protein
MAASFDGFSIGLGQFSANVADRAQMLRTGLPLASFAASRKPTDKDMELLVRRLAGRGLIEYSLTSARGGADLVVIEPQIPDYWPRLPKLHDSDTLALSRFAYQRAGLGIAARRRFVQDFRAENRRRVGQAGHTPTRQAASSGKEFSRA